MSIEELYQNIENIYNVLGDPLRVQNNDGTVIVPRVNNIITNEMVLEDLDGNAVRMTPTVQNVPVLTPGGGIAASTTTTLSSATCDKLHTPSTTIEKQDTDITVYNLNDTAISGSVIVMAHYCIDDGKWYTMGCCDNSTVSIPGTETTPGGGGTPDPGGGGGGDADGNCDLCDAGTFYQQYDITFHGIVDVANPINPSGCDNCASLIDGQTFRVTRTTSDSFDRLCFRNQCRWSYEAGDGAGGGEIGGGDGTPCDNIVVNMRVLGNNTTNCDTSLWGNAFDPVLNVSVIVNGSVFTWWDFFVGLGDSANDTAIACNFSAQKVPYARGWQGNFFTGDCKPSDPTGVTTYAEVTAVT